MVQKPIQNGRGQDLIVENLAPVGEAFVTGHDQVSSLIAADQHSEEETRLLSRERQISQFIQNQQAGRGEGV